MLKKLAGLLLGTAGLIAVLAGCEWTNGAIIYPETGYHYELDSGAMQLSHITGGVMNEYSAWVDHGHSTYTPGGTTYIRQDGWLQLWAAYPYSTGNGMELYVSGSPTVYVRQYECGWNPNPVYAYINGQWQSSWPSACSRIVNPSWGSPPP